MSDSKTITHMSYPKKRKLPSSFIAPWGYALRVHPRLSLHPFRVLDMDNDNIFPLAIYGEGVPAKRAGVRSKNTVIIPWQNNRVPWRS